MEDFSRQGFDSPLAQPELDMLGRIPISEQIYSMLTNVDKEWSVRVGLLAPWGEGKTTVCNWIAEKAQKDGHIPVFYSPWSAKTDSEMWLGLYTAIIRKLAKEKKINLERSWWKPWKHTFAHITHSNLSQAASEIHEIGKAGLGLIQSVFKISEDDIKEISNQLGDRRVIVIIDDLDRADIKLIPRLLMSLRELMDVKQFSFLLPFEDQIISNALASYNNAPGYGENFLDKILDYRVHLPPATDRQMLAFFKSETEKNFPFFTDNYLDGLQGALPKNPRKLKFLVRSLKIFDAEAGRHREDEVDWKALIFGQMIKMESEKFFHLYIRETFHPNEPEEINGETPDNPWLTAAFEKDEDKAKTIEKERIDRLIDQTGITYPQKAERIYELCEAWRAAYGWTGQHKIKYALKLLDKPEIITWRDFDALWAEWGQNGLCSAIESWINGHAEKVKKTHVEIIKELFATAAHKYSQILEMAGSAALESELNEYISQAKRVIKFMENLIIEQSYGEIDTMILTPDVLEKFLNASFPWIHFNANQGDKELREIEKAFLISWVKKAVANGLSLQFENFIHKAANNYGFSDRKEKLERELYKELGRHLGKDSIYAAADILKTQSGVINLMPFNAGGMTKDILLNVSGPFWNNGQTPNAYEILDQAAGEPIIQKNALDLLDLIRKTSNNGTPGLSQDDIKTFFQKPEVIKIIWDAAIATPLQFRRLHETREIRQFFVSMGVPEEQLSVPDWLTVTVVDVRGSSAE